MSLHPIYCPPLPLYWRVATPLLMFAAQLARYIALFRLRQTFTAVLQCTVYTIARCSERVDWKCCSMIHGIYTVSKIHNTALACYNFDVHQPLLIIFGRNVATKVRSQMVLYFSIHLTIASELPDKTRKHDNRIFSLRNVLLLCQCSTSPQSLLDSSNL